MESSKKAGDTVKIELTETVDALVFALPGETNEAIAVDHNVSNQPEKSFSSAKRQQKSSISNNISYNVENREILQALIALSESMQYLGEEGKQKLREELVYKTLEDLPNLETIQKLSEVVTSLVEKEKEPIKIEIDPVQLDASLFTEKMSMTFAELLTDIVKQRDEKEANQSVRYEFKRNEKNLVTSIIKHVV